jgi:hypothetical protein
MLSLDEMFGLGRPQAKHVIHLDAGALWYGSRLTNAEACKLAPNQNATGLQVSSAVLAGMVWTLENPSAGIVEADEMNHTRIGLRCMVVGPTTFWTRPSRIQDLSVPVDTTCLEQLSGSRATLFLFVRHGYAMRKKCALTRAQGSSNFIFSLLMGNVLEYSSIVLHGIIFVTIYCLSIILQGELLVSSRVTT